MLANGKSYRKRDRYREIPQMVYDLGADVKLLQQLAEHIDLSVETLPVSYQQKFIMDNLLIILNTNDTAASKLLNIHFFLDTMYPIQ